MKLKNKERNIIKMKKLLNEFKEFISKGNVIDMAVGVVIGSAFSKMMI